MKIGIDARFYGGEQSKGLGRYTQKLVEYLAEIDHENEYVIFLQKPQYDKWKIKNKNFKPFLADYHWYSYDEQIYMPHKIRKAKVDFMHFPHFNVPLFYRGKFVVTIHDLIITHFPTQRATTLAPWIYKMKQFAYQRVISHAAKDSTKIITVSNYSKRDLEKTFKLSPEKIDVTYEASEPATKIEYSQEEQEHTLKDYNIAKPYLLYVGNAYPHKNLEILIDAFHKMKEQKKSELDIQLVLVGKKDYFYKRVEEKIWAKDMEDDIILTGFAPDKALPVLYKNSLAYIFPSKYEGFGLPPLEAMTYETPVLSSKSSCLPEILGEAALYFDNNDVCGIINQVQKIKTDQSLRQDLIAKGRERLKSFSWQKMARETIKVYESISTKKSN
ncbi:MAG: glycosyltransferase family 1 protein [Patescibacteria group bacterium]|nr:glycosyltransferase family 4 protein [Patescibacteria group bacterium]